jgi:hypothetical protein
LKIAHETLLHRIELGKLLSHRLAYAFHVLRALCETLTSFDTSCRDFERSL